GKAEIVYAPEESFVPDVWGTPFCSAWTVAPLMPAPPEALVTLPESVPVVTAVNGLPLLVWPLTVTVTGPVDAPFGTMAVTAPAAQAVVCAATPLNRTTLLP